MRFNSKNPSKSGLFDQKNGVLFKKNPKNRTFEKGEVVFKSGVYTSGYGISQDFFNFSDLTLN